MNKCMSLVMLILASAAAGQTVDTPQMRIVFEDGYLTDWTHKQTGERVQFGKADVDEIHHRPGAWWRRGDVPDDTRAPWQLNLAKRDETAVVVSPQTSQPGGVAQAVQWSINVPYDKIDAIHFPRGLAPARLAGKDAIDAFFIRRSYYFENRDAVISSHDWRQRYYVIQGETGGLLIYMEDPDLEHFASLEFKYPRKDELVIANRSIAAPPWTESYQGGRWVIRQYTGWVNEAAAIYQAYLSKTFNLTPLVERPTRWVEDLAWTFVGAPWTSPLPHKGQARPLYNYTAGWKESMAVDEQWLENLSQVLEPDKVMFYLTAWRQDGHDRGFPTHSVDPYFAHMVGKVRRMGFHVMLHIHNHLVQDNSSFYLRYVKNQARLLGQEDGETPFGVGRDFLRDTDIIQRDKYFGSGWYDKQGLPGKMTGYHMTPAYEGWQYMKAAEILSAIRATGADAIHLDVPSAWPEEHNELYGMNSQQGMREMYRIIRETLDENGLEYVAIATELTPGEGYIRYVDLAQNTRHNSAAQILKGEYIAERLIELQLGDDLDAANAARAKLASQEEAQRFDVEMYKGALAKMRELGEPAIDAMVISPYVQGYPHLGALWPTTGGYKDDPNAPVHNHVTQALGLWYTMTKDTMPFSGGGAYNMFMDVEPWDDLEVLQIYRKRFARSGVRVQGKVFTRLEYGKFALARFWQDMNPRLAPPEDWQRGDIARHDLRDGSVMVVTRPDPLVMRWRIEGGPVMAELHLFDGWRNDDWLLSRYAPTFLDNQLDERP